jgi:hypothetical protein
MPTCTPCDTSGAGCVLSNRLIVQPECSCDKLRAQINDLQGLIKLLNLQLEQERNSRAQYGEDGAPDVDLMVRRISDEEQSAEHSATGRGLEFSYLSDLPLSTAAENGRPDDIYVSRILRPTFTTTT